MKHWKEIYGPVPASFEARVEDTLAAIQAAEAQRQTQKHAPRRRALRNTRRTALLAAAFAALLTVTAFAAGAARLGFFDTLFGTGAVDLTPPTATPAPPTPGVDRDGTVTQPAYEYTMDVGTREPITLIMPGYERTPVDEALAEQLLGPYIEQLDKTYVLPNEMDTGEHAGTKNTYGDITVTLLSYVQDEADTGYVYYSVEAPEGLRLYTRQEAGYTMAEDYFWGGSVHRPGGQPVLVDTENTTDTKAYLAMPIPRVNDDLNYMEIKDAYGEVGGFDEKFELRADRLVPAVTGEGQYVTAAVSPMGARLTSKEGLPMVLVDAVGSFVITMDDGSEYVVKRDGDYAADAVDNTTYSCGTTEGGVNSMSFCFNRIIDPEHIASVTVAVTVSRDETDARVYETETILFE